MVLYLFLFLTGLFAGLTGSMIGIGGGIIIVPMLTLALKIPIHLAIGTSIISVMVTSLSASIRFFRKEIINIPLGLTMEIPTTIGGIVGSLTVSILRYNILFIVFGVFSLAIGIFTFIKNRFLQKEPEISNLCGNLNKEQENIKNSFLDSKYFDQSCNRVIKYRVKRIIPGSFLSVFAGLFSGLLGIGGGVVKVPVMNLFMDVPIKVATSTSTYMIGITAVVSSIIYFYNGFINPFITIPVIIGVLAGGLTGSFTALKMKGRSIALIILIVFTIIGILMFLRGAGILEY